MEHFARANDGPDYDGNRQYSTTKAFSAWWSAAMARRHTGSVSIYTVSPGANKGTNAARHATGGFKLMIGFMRRFGKFLGMDQPIEKGAGRYIDVLHGNGGPFRNGHSLRRTAGPRSQCRPDRGLPSPRRASRDGYDSHGDSGHPTDSHRWTLTVA